MQFNELLQSDHTTYKQQNVTDIPEVPPYALLSHYPSKVTTLLTSITIDLFFLLLNLHKWHHTVYIHVSQFLEASVMFVRFI